ncbi:hypothetical protein CEXT_813551 [Caerostris extrusa]|uniref:Uncharacterized protein n=1 Tax=Caerostris extrusa TaxID=172846 RepID=A0AAV4ME27_CAEEX|nr:hypothetical protein CEXT_813551 [Caerostris extrusa]
MGQFQESDNRLAAAADDCRAAERGVMCQRAPVSSPEPDFRPRQKHLATVIKEKTGLKTVLQAGVLCTVDSKISQ